MVIPEIGITILLFYTYILECSNGALYTGWTNNLQNRLDNHNAGKGAKYTRANRPVKLVASWSFDTKVEAMKWEWKLKHMSRATKLRMIANPYLEHADSECKFRSEQTDLVANSQ